jgi:hypothetical protein
MDRIDRLERSLRRWKVGTLAAVGLAFGAGAAQDSTPQFLTVRELKLVDEKGVVRMVIDPDRGTEGPAIIMYGKDGKTAATWKVDDTQRYSEIRFFDPKTGKATIGIDDVGRQGRVSVRNQYGKESQFYAPGSVSF